jgi:type VI secretion system protein VasI
MKIQMTVLVSLLIAFSSYAEAVNYNSATQIVTIPQVEVDGKPTMQDAQLKLRPDGLLELVGYTPIVQNTGNKGKWILKESTSPVTGAKTALIYVMGDNTSTKYIGTLPLLYIRCQDKQMDIFIDFAAYLGSSNNMISYKIGADAFKSERWLASDSGTALFYPANVKDFSQSLFNKNSFAAEAQSYSNGKMTGVFDISGVENAITPVRQACGW